MTASLIAWDDLAERVNADGEFRLAARFWSAPPETSKRAADRIPGASFAPMPGLGHFPMCEDPERFLAALLPVLEKIRAAGSAP